MDLRAEHARGALPRLLDHGRRLQRACRVDDAVEAAVAGSGRLERARDLVAIGHVGRHDQDFRSAGLEVEYAGKRPADPVVLPRPLGPSPPVEASIAR